MAPKIKLKLIAAVLLTVAFQSQANAQSSDLIILKGEVREHDKHSPLVHASVVFIMPDSSRLAALTDESGKFIRRIRKKEDIGILVQYLGFEPIKTSLSKLAVTSRGDTLLLPPFQLKPSNNLLQEVVVKASPITIQNDGSKIIYQVDRDIESKLSSLFSILPKVPLLSLDYNQNVLLKGSSKFVVLLDGKENALFLMSLQDALQSIPAASIKSIEIINEIPPRYQQTNITGIINIITKNGIEGATMTLSASSNIPFDVKGGAYGVLKTQKSTVVLNTATMEGNTIESIRENHIQFIGDFGQSTQATERVRQKASQRTLELASSHDLDSLNLLTFSVSGMYNPKDSELIANVNQTGSVAFTQLSDRNSKRHDYKIEANFENRAKRNTERIFTLLYQLETGKETGLSEAGFLEQRNASYNNFNQNSSFLNTQHTLDASYILPFKHVNIEAGAKGISRSNSTTILLYEKQSADEPFVLNKGKSTDFSFRQDILSYFVAGNLALGEKWRTRMALNHDLVKESRVENIIYNKIALNYQNFTPSFNLSRSITPQSNLSFNYTAQVVRPSIEQLSPLLDYTTPTLVYMGNADLKPEIRNTFSLTVSRFKASFFSMSLSYATLKNQIQNLSYNRERTNEINFINVDRASSWGLVLNNNLPITPKLRFSNTLFGNYYNFKGAQSEQGLSAQGFLNMSYRANSKYSGSLNYIYNGPHYTYQSRNYITDQLYLTFTGNELGNKLNYSVSLRNPLYKNRSSENRILNDAFSQNIMHIQPQRSISIRVSYRFGQLKVRDIKRTEKTIENTDFKRLDPKEKIN